MLLTEFKEVLALDKRINDLHRELSVLYEERKAITISTSQSPGFTRSTASSANTQATTSWEHEQYEILRTAWLKFDLAIPAYKTLHKKLTMAKATLATLNASSATKDCFELFLCPPISRLASQSGLATGIAAKSKPQRHWKVLLAYKQPAGLPIEDDQLFFDSQQYLFGGYDMQGLNMREYGLYTMLQSAPIDVERWSLLPAQQTEDQQQIVCAGYIGNQYRYVSDDKRSLLGENSFRPAMEVK